ncbi:MAG: alpha/beta hydrolase fold domain-containing protein [Piscinibacter sp.]|uniref:alpha/beta hydrolase fold domain-containing protein n=1 Tax=Piscinibacter sp. TaxID=1903157 RepID=UPI002584DEC8|nr:alpha/beta hydrolase fold domain-containing protein [Piscinibacter sp.]MCW5662375.1 alpha/beta hydrolase fold domain-containing protein [Piscinibacter sp.]
MSALPHTEPAWTDRRIERPGTAPLTLRLYGLGRCTPGTPLVLHFHAGAFTGGTLAEGATVAQALAAAGSVVASLDYPVAPARPFPQALEAGHAALQWLHAQRKGLAGLRAPLYVAGEEAGGNLAAALAMVARDRGGPELAGAILLSPMLDMCVATASQRDAHNGPVGCRWADGWRAYLSRADDAVHPYAVPARALRLAGLPRTLLISAADDPLRDETLAFAQRLRGAGIAAEAQLLPGPTGWPGSYRDASPAWAAALHAPLHSFLHSESSRGSTA